MVGVVIVEGFGGPSFYLERRTRIVADGLVSYAESNSDAEDPDLDDFGEDLDTGGVVLDDLNWRVEKLRLEEQNTQRFLKSKPRFLPYDDCRRWVQAWGQRWETAKDWENWIAMGEKRNSYIPSRPDEYYGTLGQWKGWEHFLGSRKSKDGKNETNNDK
jgi:hypothetical protein